MSKLVEALNGLPVRDKTLVKGFVGMAILTLALGLIYGALTAFGRAGFLDMEKSTAYQMLTLHGVTIFFYWLYFAQAALVLVLAYVYTEHAEGIAWRAAAWIGLALMVVGFVLNQYATYSGAAILYDGQPNLIEYDKWLGGLFYLGYLFLSVGLFVVALSAVATALKPRVEGKIANWSAISFASVAWAGLLMVSAIAAVNVFLPAAWWAFGFGNQPADYTMSWHVLFHNVHYLPLMAAILISYVMVEEITGVKSIFGARFSKIVFSLYLILVPPTSLYHMFLEPGLSDVVKVVGSLLSLFIGIPTVMVFLTVIASLEAHARAQGGRGLFGWMRMLPWRNPAMAAMIMAVVNLALGGAFSFILIQEKFAPLLSDTFFVPGYFHFLTLGTVTLCFIAGFMYVIPGVTRRELWRPSVLAKNAYVMTAGLFVFGAAGITAGYLGVPRRVFDVAYEGVAPGVWKSLMAGMGVGAVIMTITLAVYVYGLVRTFMGSTVPASETPVKLPSVTWGDAVSVGRHAVWIGPLSVVALVAVMYVFTALSFELLEAAPIAATGGHAAH